MRPIVTDVLRGVVNASVCWCVLGTWLSPAKTVKPIETPFGAQMQLQTRFLRFYSCYVFTIFNVFFVLKTLVQINPLKVFNDSLYRLLR